MHNSTHKFSFLEGKSYEVTISVDLEILLDVHHFANVLEGEKSVLVRV